MNFGPGQIIANAGIVALNATNLELSITTSAPANVLVDTYGVFVSRLQNNLTCGQQTSTNNIAGTVTATCPASFSLTGGGCSSSSFYDHTYQSEPAESTQGGLPPSMRRRGSASGIQSRMLIRVEAACTSSRAKLKRQLS